MPAPAVAPTAPLIPSDDPAYIEQMAAKGAAAVDGTPPASDRPEWLPEKFQSPEDLAKAYKELEQKLGKPPAPAADPAADPAATTPPADPLAIDETAAAAAQAAGFKMSDLNAEYAANGTLTDETYGKLEAAGFSRDDVDTYIEGRKALVSRIEEQGYSVLGGKEDYDAMKGWAKANLTAAEIQAFNRAVGDADTRDLAIHGMAAKYRAAVGSEPSTKIIPNSNPGTAGSVYASTAEMRADMSDPRYQTDAAFRAAVAAKLGRSDIL